MRQRTTVVACVVIALVNAACGYTLAGRGSFLPEYIQTIGVPLFTNNTPVFEVEQELTRQVRTEFVGRGRYRVVPGTEGVDAVVEGVINSIQVAPASFTDGQQATRYVFTLSASIIFRDLKTNDVLWENPRLVFSDDYEVTTGTVDVSNIALFFGQQSNAVERVAGDFAKTVVSSILEAF